MASRPSRPPTKRLVCRPAIASVAPSRDPLEWLAARLPLPLLLLALPFVAVGLVAAGLCAGLRYQFWDTAFGLAVCAGVVWLFLAYLGIV